MRLKESLRSVTMPADAHSTDGLPLGLNSLEPTDAGLFHPPYPITRIMLTLFCLNTPLKTGINRRYMHKN